MRWGSKIGCTKIKMINVTFTKYMGIGTEEDIPPSQIKPSVLSRDGLLWTFLLVIREVNLSGETAAARRRASISSLPAHSYVRNPIHTMCPRWRVCTDMVSD